MGHHTRYTIIKLFLKLFEIFCFLRIKEPPLYATVQKDSRGKVVETKTNDSPPYNFRQAMTGMF